MNPTGISLNEESLERIQYCKFVIFQIILPILEQGHKKDQRGLNYMNIQNILKI